jgi:hypothetical protein
MNKHLVTRSILSVVLVLGIQVTQFAQDTSNTNYKADLEEHESMVGLVRTINTLESADFLQSGSYESWHALLDRHSTDLNRWLATFYPHGSNAHFEDAREIFPGWSLRLNLNADGQGYVLVLEGTADKVGYAVLSDERGVGRECRYIQ